MQRAQSTDLPAIQDLLQSCGLPYEDLGPAALEHVLVCREEDALRGVVGVEPYEHVALLRSLAVISDCRNEGVGTRLVRAIEQRARQQRIHTLYLLTTTAAEYFQQHGYEHVDREALPDSIQQTEEATRLCPSSATCMRKTLGAPTHS